MNATSKTVMMIGGGLQEIKAVTMAQEAGYKVLVTDRNANAPCFEYADYVAVIDGRDVENLIAYVLINQEELNITGVFTLTELVTSVAAVSSATGLPSVSLSSAVACQNKQLCKKIWSDNDIPTPKGGVVTTLNDAQILFNELGQRVFVKPIIGFGGISSRKIISQNELKKFFIDNGQEMVMEELLEGSMHDVNGLIDNHGNFHPMGVVDRFFLDDFPVEQKISTPSSLNHNEQVALYELLEKSVKALGINWGPVKGDAVFVNGEFRMLEVAPRLHGPKNSIYLLPYSGFNCLELALSIINGIEAEYRNKISQDLQCVCVAVLPAPGEKFNLYSAKGAATKDGIKKVLIFKEHHSIVTEYKNATDVPAYIFATGKDLEECNENLNKTQLFKG